MASEGRVAALPGAAWHGDAVCVVCNCRLQLIDLHAARVNAQAEFDRTFRAVVKAEDYRHRKLLFMSCLNSDISRQEDRLFPLTTCVPWVACLQDGEEGSRSMEQPGIIDQLLQQGMENPDRIDLESAIRQMIEAREIRIAV